MNKLEDKIKALSSALPMSLILILSRWKMQKVLCSPSLAFDSAHVKLSEL